MTASQVENILYSVWFRVSVICLFGLLGFYLAMKWWMMQDTSTIQELIRYMGFRNLQSTGLKFN